MHARISRISHVLPNVKNRKKIIQACIFFSHHCPIKVLMPYIACHSYLGDQLDFAT